MIILNINAKDIPNKPNLVTTENPQFQCIFTLRILLGKGFSIDVADQTKLKFNSIEIANKFFSNFWFGEPATLLGPFQYTEDNMYIWDTVKTLDKSKYTFITGGERIADNLYLAVVNQYALEIKLKIG